ncbi:MAG: superoxide dismutase [Myxococcota bacterium]
MTFELPPLPYAKDALTPFMSAETFDFHYGKHHAAYVNNLNKLVAGTDNEGKSLEDIIASVSSGPLFNNSAQVWNHTFFWNCMKPAGGGEPTGDLAAAITRDFGSFQAFKEKFAATAAGQFGSGWGWLVAKNGKLEVMATANADTPSKHSATALFTVDVWEHAYYIDYRNDRAKFIATVVDKLANWDFATENLKKVG